MSHCSTIGTRTGRLCRGSKVRNTSGRRKGEGYAPSCPTLGVARRSPIFSTCAKGARRAWMMSPNPPDAGSSFNRNHAPDVAKQIERARRSEPVGAIGCPSGVQRVGLATAEPHSAPNSEGFREQALSELERRALFVFVGRPRDCGSVRRARDFLHFLAHLAFSGEGD